MILYKEDDRYPVMVLKFILSLIICAGMGFLALLLVYSLPRENMKKHVFENADFYSDSYMLVDGYKSTLLDIYTDTTMFSEVICPSSGRLISDVMLCPRWRLLGEENDYQLIANYSNDDEVQVTHVHYPRYWHGYLAILKPLLIFFNVADLHLIYFFVQSVLLLLIIIGLIKRNQTSLAVCWGIGVLIINPMVTALNFQNASIFFTILLSIFFLTYSGKLDENYLVKKQCFFFFQIIGMLVAYFDFLTYPIAALGVPLLFLLYFSDTKDAMQRIKYVIFHSVMFFAGYLGMYFCKWGLATLFTDMNVFKDAYDEIMIMLNANNVEGAEITIASGMMKIFSHYIQPPYLLLIIGGVIYVAVVSRKSKPTRTWFYRNVSVILVAFYPFCHMLASTHSFYHHHFVYREFVVTVLAVLFVLLDKNNFNS